MFNLLIDIDRNVVFDVMTDMPGKINVIVRDNDVCTFYRPIVKKLPRIEFEEAKHICDLLKLTLDEVIEKTKQYIYKLTNQ